MKKNVFTIIIFVFISFLLVCKDSTNQKINPQEKKITRDKYQQQRYEMVDTQIRSRGVKDELVLKAMRKVPRHKFVPSSL